MTHKEVWNNLINLLEASDLYKSENGELQYLLGYIDALSDSIIESTDTTISNSGQCSYWHSGQCYGTKEGDRVDCGGFKSRCNL